MAKIVNLGSLCFDRVYYVAAVVRTGETLRARNTALFPGGKGLNQSLAARRAGAEVIHVGCVGRDGEPLRTLLREEGVGVAGLRLQQDIDTAHAIIQLDPAGENAIVIVGGSNFAITAADVEYALARLSKGDWLLLQNEINDLAEVLRAAHACGAQICLNLAPYSDAAQNYPLEVVDLLIVNEIEAEGLTGAISAEAAMPELRRRVPHGTIVTTLGEHGLLWDAGDGVARLRAYRVDNVDGTGAGDAFIGYLLAGLVAELPLAEALRRGSAAGALAASRAGAATSIPHALDVDALVARR